MSKTAPVFNSAAKADQPYVFDLDREVADFYCSHPEQKKKIFFIEAASASGMLLYRGDENDEDEVADLLAGNGDLQDIVKEVYRTGICKSVRFEEAGYDFVILKLPRNLKSVSLLGYSTPSDLADLFSFDHETGHLICPEGTTAGDRRREGIADAYAVIRHIQRFGADSEGLKDLVAMRAVEMILGRDESHFTAPIIEKIIADSKKIDFSVLSPAETVRQAQRYAVDNDIDTQLLNYIAGHFNVLKLNATQIAEGDFSALRSFGDFVLKTEIPEAFKWGATIVRALLDGNIGVDGACLPKPKGPEWARLRYDIDARAARFTQPQRSKLVVVSKL